MPEVLEDSDIPEANETTPTMPVPQITFVRIESIEARVGSSAVLRREAYDGVFDLEGRGASKVGALRFLGDSNMFGAKKALAKPVSQATLARFFATSML